MEFAKDLKAVLDHLFWEILLLFPFESVGAQLTYP